MKVATRLLAWSIHTFSLYCTQRLFRLKLFFVAALLFHSHEAPTSWAAGLICCRLLTISISGMAVQWCAYANSRDAVRKRMAWIDKYELTEITSEIQSRLAEDTLSTLVFPKFVQLQWFRKSMGLRLEYVPYRAFVVRPKAGSTIGELKAYTNFIGTSLVFFTEKPNFDDPLSKFHLFHELAHISKYGVAATSKGEQLFCLLVAEVLTLYMLGPASWIFYALLMAFAILNFVEITCQKIELELKADAYACRRMGSTGDIRLVLEDHAAMLPELKNRLGFVDWVLEERRLNQLERALHLSESGRLDSLTVGPTDIGNMFFPAFVSTFFIIFAAYRAVPPSAAFLCGMVVSAIALQTHVAVPFFGRAVQCERYFDTYMSVQPIIERISKWIESADRAGHTDVEPPPHVVEALASLKEFYIGSDHAKHAIMSESLVVIGDWDWNAADAGNSAIPAKVINAVKKVRETFRFVIDESKQNEFSKCLEHLEALIAKGSNPG